MAHPGGGAQAHARFKQYEYRANSSLVLTADSRPRDTHEPTGEPESLWGKIGPKSFGDRAYRDKPWRSKKRRLQEESVFTSSDEGVYQPKTKEKRGALEAMLSLVSIGRLITDYHDGDDAVFNGDDGLNNDVGVAVEFEENEEEEEESDLDMVLEDEEEDDDVVEDIDAYWLQRKISQAYDENIDPQLSQKLAEEVLKILAEGDRLLKVAWCTRLARAEDQEKSKEMEEEMMGYCERQKNLEKSIKEAAQQLKDETSGDGDRKRHELVAGDADGGWLKGQRQLLDL
ncbi:DExH-box ATP-dependent RNA helicase DExH12 [Sesamum alatum]|uniref:DExH-box ATP-dependent RNA helicase DExH12 n=1 Tax=Sesamum alatum TaxID=300844 RepID=A0AAE2CN38_9LAMI|nr:DExH-box ATP-dependent RNA helicase DExH12 [Sesamum alatum]